MLYSSVACYVCSRCTVWTAVDTHFNQTIQRIVNYQQGTFRSRSVANEFYIVHQ